MSDQAVTSERESQRRIVPFHPILFAAFPLLTLYAANIGRFPIAQIERPLAMALATAAAVWAVFLALTRHIRRSAIAASVVVLAFFSYGHLNNLLPGGVRWLAAPVCVTLVVSALYVVSRSRLALMDATRVLNFAAVVLVAPSCWSIGNSFIHPSAAELATAPGKAAPLVVAPFLGPEPGDQTPLPAAKVTERPDIYYIILDAYGRADRLKSFYGFDNGPLIAALEKRGFYIPRHSHANYDQTTLCLPSALNMNYLHVPESPGTLPEDFGQLVPLRQMIDENRVAGFLGRLGYRYVNVWGGMEETRVLTADVILNTDQEKSSFEEEASGLTPLEATKAGQKARYDEHRNRIVHGFDCLEQMPGEQSPKFVFAHIMAPHPPFVLGPNGEAVYPSGPMSMSDGSMLLTDIGKAAYQKGYAGQLQYVNRRILAAIDSILAKSKKPPVIIVQGDHGSRMSLNWESQEKTDLREPFSIMNAYYVPRAVRKDLYETITPVNSFRIVLSRLFGANLPKLPDRSYYSTASRPLVFSDVTAAVAAGG